MSALVNLTEPFSFEQITFVVQGPIVANFHDGFTKRLTQTIREYFPGSKLIVSTWNGEDTSALDADFVILSEDPGSLFLDKEERYANNVNRQIISTVAALRKVQTRYVVKLRSDLIFINNQLATLIRDYIHKQAKERGILSNYCIISNFTSIKPSKYFPFLFHPCDWIFAGLTSDIRKIWYSLECADVETCSPEVSKYKGIADPQNFVLRPESFIWIQFLEKNSFFSFVKGRRELEMESEKSIFENLVIINNFNLGIRTQKIKLAKGFFHSGTTYNALTSNRVRRRLGIRLKQRVKIQDVKSEFARLLYPTYRLQMKFSQKLRTESARLCSAKNESAESQNPQNIPTRSKK